MSEHGSAGLDGTTHADGCYAWGRRHYDCAVREIEKLIAERDAAFLMSRCECASNECCAEAAEAERDALRERIANEAK